MVGGGGGGGGRGDPPFFGVSDLSPSKKRHFSNVDRKRKVTKNHAKNRLSVNSTPLATPPYFSKRQKG